MRLLLVEDETRLARALLRGLTADGFAVDVVGDGTSGLARARHGQYDAVLLDVMLPGLSGYEVVKRLRAENNWVPVMMVSAKDGPTTRPTGSTTARTTTSPSPSTTSSCWPGCAPCCVGRAIPDHRS